MILLHVETVFLLILGCIGFHIIVLAGSSYDMNAVLHSNTHTVMFPKQQVRRIFIIAETALSVSPHSNYFQVLNGLL